MLWMAIGQDCEGPSCLQCMKWLSSLIYVSLTIPSPWWQSFDTRISAQSANFFKASSSQWIQVLTCHFVRLNCIHLGLWAYAKSCHCKCESPISCRAKSQNVAARSCEPVFCWLIALFLLQRPWWKLTTVAKVPMLSFLATTLWAMPSPLASFFYMLEVTIPLSIVHLNSLLWTQLIQPGSWTF